MTTHTMTTKKKSWTASMPYQILSFWVFYTLLFLGIMFVAFHPFLSSKTTMIWTQDGMGQYYWSLEYTVRYLKEAVKSILSGNFNLKMYDFTIGMGSDIRSFFKIDPFTFLAALFPATMKTSHVYTILSVFRIYMIGIAFACYGFFMKQKSSNVLVGAIVYTFTSYTYYQVMRHPQFAMASILLPLLLIGLEQVIRRQNFLFYSLMVGISLMISYYFLYIDTFIMGCYALLHLPDIYKKHHVKEFFCMLGRIIVSYLLGVGMALAFFFPSIARYFLSSRSSGGDGISFDLFSYPTAYRLRNIFLGMVRPKLTIGYATALGMCAIVFPALVSLYSRKIKERLSSKIAVIVGVLFLQLPIFAYILSGFSGLHNRWCYAFVFLMAFIVMIEFDAICTMNWIRIGICLTINVVYGVCIYLNQLTGATFLTGLKIYSAFTLCLILSKIFRSLPWIPEKISASLVKTGMVLLCAAVVAYNGFYIMSSFVAEFSAEAGADSYYSSSVFQTLADIEDRSGDFYRSDSHLMTNGNYNNAPVGLQYNGFSEFNSLIDSEITDYMTETENVGMGGSIRMLSLDGRSAQEALACSKYYMASKDTDQMVPYGFRLDSSLGNEEVDVYVNQNLLPIGYSYDSLRSETEVDSMDSIEKTQVELQDAVLSEEDLQDFTELPVNSGSSGDITEGEMEITEVDPAYTIEGDASLDGASITVLPDDATVDPSANTKVIKFSIEAQPHSETYLRFSDVDLGDRNQCTLKIKLQGDVKTILLRSLSDPYSLGGDDYTVNLGYSEEAETLNGKIIFKSAGTYTIGSCKVYHVSMENYDQALDDLREESLQDVTLDTNQISGNVSVSGEKLMAFSIPYNVGWKVYVDGEETKIYHVNTIYMGIRLTEGDHHIVVKYASPGNKIGIIGSLIFCLIFLILFLRWIMVCMRRKRLSGGKTEEKKE